ncbi:MAG: serine/threonine-protein kinase [Syntrophales bacterium]|nr:serine/threonine-protein kinase [Syntrophales bacterium]
MKKIRTSLLMDSMIALVLTVLFFVACLISWAPLEELEYQLYDFGSQMRQRESTSPVVVISIDDYSIARIGRWPWPRAYIAQIVNILKQAEAKVIGLDIIYSEADLNQGLVEIRNIIKGIESDPKLQKNAQVGSLYSTLRETDRKLDNDAILAASIGENKKVVLPLYFTLGKVAGGSANTPDYLKRNSLPASGREEVLTAREITPPIPEFAQGALALGHINILTDSDGTVRGEPLLINYESRLYPSFALQLTLKYLNYDLSDVQLLQGLKISNFTIPTDEYARILISFKKGVPNYSFADVLGNTVPATTFKNKIVIVAQSASGLGMPLTTPVGIHAPSWTIITSVVDNIINRDHIVRPDWSFYMEVGAMVVFGLFLAIGIPLLRARISAVISLTLLVIWVGACEYLFVVNGYWIKGLYPSLLLTIGYIVIVSKRYFLTEQSKERIEADSVETNKMLGLSFQGQGMLDMAFEKFRKCSIEDESIQELVYNLGLDFERKRMFNKAVAAYEYIAQAGSFKDVEERIKKLKTVGDTMIFGLGGGRKDATVLMDNADTKPTLGRYEITKELGRGAMGTVFLGKDPRINREVAIKTLRYEEIDAEQLAEVKKRFFREAEAAGKLSHPNIVTIYDVGEDYDIAYMAMELLDGADLTKYSQKDNLLPLPEVLRIIGAVAGALDYAHENGVVHRDIKPANIMILNNGEIRVTDFGIARVMTTSKTQTGVILGTPSYMSPEQIAGQRVDGRSDLFSLGVVFYELLTGEKPFQGDSIATLMFNITTGSPRPLKELAPELPEMCTVVIERMLAKDRDGRYAKGKDLVSDLSQCLSKGIPS